MIAILCLFLKRMRGLATFSLFHILWIANLMLSVGITNGWKQIRSTTRACLKRRLTHRKVLSKRNYTSIIENGQKMAETTGMRYKNDNLVTRTQKWMDQSAASVKLKTLTDCP